MQQTTKPLHYRGRTWPGPSFYVRSEGRYNHLLEPVDNRDSQGFGILIEAPFWEIFMRPERFFITDRSWRIIEPLLPGSSRSRGVTAKDNRLFLEAVLWKVRVGGAWRDLPPGFGAWNSVC